MQDVLLKLHRLEEKVNQLSQKMEYLRKENIMLIEENVRLKQETEKSRSGGIHALGGTVVSSSIGSEIENHADQLRQDLDKYISEVDKCIDLINNM